VCRKGIVCPRSDRRRPEANIEKWHRCRHRKRLRKLASTGLLLLIVIEIKNSYPYPFHTDNSRSHRSRYDRDTFGPKPLGELHRRFQINNWRAHCQPRLSFVLTIFDHSAIRKIDYFWPLAKTIGLYFSKSVPLMICCEFQLSWTTTGHTRHLFRGRSQNRASATRLFSVTSELARLSR